MGERSLSPSAKKAIRDNPDSSIVFLDDNWSISVVDIVLRCPVDYGMNGATGLKYEALKDFVRWACPDGYKKDHIEREFIPLILSLGSFYCNELNSNRKG